MGNYQLGRSRVGMGIMVPDIDFNELNHSSNAASRWLRLIFPTPQFENDAAALCHRYDLGGTECADRLRSLYFRHFRTSIDPREFLKIPLRLSSVAASIACRNNAWSPLVSDIGAKEGISLALPWFAAIAVVLLSRAFIIPLLVLILLLDYFVVKLGQYTALYSERGLTLVTQYGPKLLATPPIIAITLLTSFARHLC